MSFASTLKANKDMSAPELPEPAHANVDSMLSRKFGREVANYFSGSPLNRVSFLRADHIFLSTALKHPSTSFLLFKDLQPLVRENETAAKENSNADTFMSFAPYALSKLKLADVEPLIGRDPYEKTEEQMQNEYNSTITIPQLIFLGLDEGKIDSGLSWKKGGADAKPGAEEYKGAPLFAVDVSPKGSVKERAEELIGKVSGSEHKFLEGRMLLGFEAGEAAIYANARHLLDWNARNPFCAGCGQPTLSVNGGYKRTCPPKDAARLSGSIGSTTGEKPTADRPDCATRHGISNLCFPRTDPTVIMAVLSADGKSVLLGRQKRFPPGFYSTLAGFLEPGESVEEAVRREVWEEAGVRVGRVVVHSTQPWPYPANLMIGAIGQATPEGSKIDLGNDPELEDARWCPFDELREALKIGTSGLGDPPQAEYKGGLRLPPRTAIANILLNGLVDGFAGTGGKL